MAVAVFGSSMSSVPAPADQTKPALRRATYVHVSDLTSAYNIDHARLEQELNRVKAESLEATLPDKAAKIEAQVDPNGEVAELDAALSPGPQKRLQPPRGGFNLCVLVGRVNVVVDKRRVDRSRVRLAEVEIGDETGTVSLRARDEQIDVLEEVSKRSGAAVLRNCTLELYQGKHIRLAVTKWGKLCVYPDNVASTPPPPSKMNFDRNFSLIDLSIVASEMVDVHTDLPYSNKQSKSPESSDTGGRQSSSKGSGQTHTKQQNQSSARRGSRDRRQSRGKSGGSAQAHYSGKQGDRGMMQPQPQPNHMRYHGLHNFPRFEQGMDMRQYPYAHAGQQEVLSPASAQQLLLHHQYELQQRQFQQMYSHGQPDRHTSTVGQVQSPGMIIQPAATPSGSFDYTGSGSDQHPSVIPMVGSNQMLPPLNMTSSTVQAGLSPLASGHTQELHGSSTTASAAKDGSSSHPKVALSHVEQMHQMTISPDDPHSLPGKMNPDAMSFAPSAYINPQVVSQTAQTYFPPYNPSQPNSGATYSSYPQGMMYNQQASSSGAPRPELHIHQQHESTSSGADSTRGGGKKKAK